MNIDKSVNVIVGPNAVGKSTLLETVRLAKAILAPRLSTDAAQALIGIGALSPHQQAIGGPSLDFGSVSNDVTRSINLGLKIELDNSEVDILKSELGNLALLSLQTQFVGQGVDNALAFTQFLSSPAGQEKLQSALTETIQLISALGSNFHLDIDLELSPADKTLRGANALHQSILTILDRRLPSHKTLFNLFPADRTFPVGEQSIQLGSGDAQQQIMSYMATPSLKYSRLKQVIVQSTLLNPNGKELIENEFNLIFDKLLPGKKFAGAEINELGLVKILVKDEKRGKIFDIDHMSSGEKGLVLTFLFIRLNMQAGGIVLLDEPELHLNSAVQKNILPFFIEYCAKPLSLQAIICTHSPEIVKDAFENSNCGLFHLRSGEDLTPILQQDHDPLFEVFSRLGNSAADILFTRGNIYVEGDHDSIIIQAGFPSIVSGYKITPLGGRGDIEREAPLLQEEEKRSKLHKKQLFILDNDRSLSSLKSTNLVRIHQLERYCIENYLLDDEILYDLISSHAKLPVESRGRFPAMLEDLAISQTTEIAVKEVYEKLMPETPGIRYQEIKNKTAEDISDILSHRLQLISTQTQHFDKIAWTKTFIEKHKERQEELSSQWRSTWRERCSGKKLIDDLYIKFEISMKKSEFKKEIIKRMADKRSETWRVLRDVISNELT